MKKLLLSILGLMLVSPLLQAQNDPFVTTWITTEIDETIRLITVGGDSLTNYNTTIDWGDGSPVEQFTGDAPEITHIFAEPDTFQIQITGTFPALTSSDANDLRLVSIDAWGDIQWEFLEHAFANYPNLEVKATDVPDLSSVTSLLGMFNVSGRNAPDSTGNWDLSGWDISNVITLERMFRGANKFNGDISTWNTSNVSNMERTFEGATAFNGDISNWDVSNVITFESMFRDARSFSGDLSSWDISSAQNLRVMFSGTRLFDSDISNWDVSNVTNFEFMFLSSRFNQPIGNWNMSSAQSLNGMFQNNSLFNQDISSWDVSSVTNMNGLFFGTRFNQDISSWDVSSVQQMSAMFRRSRFNQDISNWDVSSVTVFSDTFKDNLDFNQNLGNWNVSAALTMNNIFQGARLSTENYDAILSSWASRPVQPNIRFHGGQSLHSTASDSARQVLTDAGWTIEDRGRYIPRSVAAYSFDDGTATDITRINGNDGNVVGAVPGVDRFGNSNQAMQFDGVDDYIEFPDAPDFQFGVNDFSISFWINMTSNNAYGFILGKRGIQGSQNRYEFITNATQDESILANIQSSTPVNTAERVVNIQQQRWEHIAYIYKQEDEELIYVNGELRIQRPITDGRFRGFDVTNAPFMIGNNSPTGSEPFEGFVDDVALYNYALSQAEIDSLWDGFRATSNEEPGNIVPALFALEQNYPNPFNPSTNISYSLPSASEVKIEIFNMLGQNIATLVNEHQIAGNHTIQFDASSLSSGIYLYRLTAGSFVQTKKLTLIK